MITPHIGVVLNWRNEDNKSGLYSIHIRIKIGNSARYFKVDTPQKVKLNEWSGKDNSWVKSIHPFAFEINNKISEKKNIINELVKRNYIFNKNLTFKEIQNYLNKKGDRNSFLEYMEAYILRPPHAIEENTLKKYRTTLKHLKRFKSLLVFSDIDNMLISEFYLFMQKDLNLQGAACKKYMEAFKKVIRHARKENYISPSQMEFLFDDIKIKVQKAKRTFLEIEEIRKWKKVKIPKNKSYLERDRDLFLFQLYTGYYYKDLLIFTKSQIVADHEFGNFIIGARDKNGNQTIIPLFKFPYAGEVLKKYESPISDIRAFDPSYFIEEPAYNRNLKEIAKLAGINKAVSNKVARHTNAQLWVRFGARGAVISKMLGHTKQETTTNYYDVDLPEIIEGTKGVDFAKLGI